MALLIKRCFEFYYHAMTELADPRSNDWLLVKSPIPMIAIIVMYLWFVKEGGPNFMKNRKAFQLDKVIITYNLMQIMFCSYLIITAFKYMRELDWRCAEIDYSSPGIAEKAYGYFMLKIFDMADTVFFVLRKKNSQITFLHIYHHSGMVCLGWLGVKYFCGGHGLYMPYINTFVHAVMYTYYFLSILDVNGKRSIWWKQHITQIQMTQFALIFVLYLRPLFTPNCNFPKALLIGCIPQNLFMFILFADFYYKTYIRPKTKNNM